MSAEDQTPPSPKPNRGTDAPASRKRGVEKRPAEDTSAASAAKDLGSDIKKTAGPKNIIAEGAAHAAGLGAAKSAVDGARDYTRTERANAPDDGIDDTSGPDSGEPRPDKAKANRRQKARTGAAKSAGVAGRSVGAKDAGPFVRKGTDSDGSASGDASATASGAKDGAKIGAAIGGVGAPVGAAVGGALQAAKTKNGRRAMVLWAVLPVLIPFLLITLLVVVLMPAIEEGGESQSEGDSVETAAGDGVPYAAAGIYQQASGTNGVPWEILAAIIDVQQDGNHPEEEAPPLSEDEARRAVKSNAEVGPARLLAGDAVESASAEEVAPLDLNVRDLANLEDTSVLLAELLDEYASQVASERPDNDVEDFSLDVDVVISENPRDSGPELMRFIQGADPSENQLGLNHDDLDEDGDGDPLNDSDHISLRETYIEAIGMLPIADAEANAEKILDMAMMWHLGRSARCNTGGDRDEAPGGWANPAVGPVTSKYGMRFHPILRVYKLHDGTDIAPPQGKPVFAASSGTVNVAGESWAGPHHVVIDHGGGVSTEYGHMDSATVKTGQQVEAGQQIGTVGSEGYSTGPHLHFMVVENGEPIDPEPFMESKGVTLGKDAPTLVRGGPSASANVGFQNTAADSVSGAVGVAQANIPNRISRGRFRSSMGWLVSQNPDFIALNEVGGRSIAEIEGAAPGYTAYREPHLTRGRSRQYTIHEKSDVVAWRSDVWKQVDGGRVQIVKNDHAWYQGKRKVWNYYATWAQLERRSDGATISFVSAHHMTNPMKFPRQHGNPPMSRKEQYGAGMDTLLDLEGELSQDGPVIISGDMNTHDGAKYKRADWTAVSKMRDANYAWHGHSVDYIFYQQDNGITPIKEVVGPYAELGDHKMIAARLQMDGSGSLPKSWTGTSATGEKATLDRKQLEFAATVAQKGTEMGVSNDGIIIAFMVALVESAGINSATAGRAFNNYASEVYPETLGKEYPKGAVGSDHDSVGIFQQRPASGWGDPLAIMDIGYAASAFFGGPDGPNSGSPAGLLDHPGWENRPKGEVAQDVQVSAFPDRYAAWESAAAELLDVVHGAGDDGDGNDCGDEAPPQSEGYDVASFNVLGWNDTAPGGERPEWPGGGRRFPEAIDHLEGKGASIAALQEMHPRNQAYFHKNFSDEWDYHAGTEDYVIWNREDWRLVRSEEVKIPYLRGRPRSQPFVLLERTSTGEKIWFLGVHNAGDEQGAALRWRRQALRAELAAVKSKRSDGFPVFLAGDFGDARDGASRSQCVLTPHMTNAFGKSRNDCRKPAGDAAADHIYSTGVTLKGGAVDRTPLDKKLSDHPLVMATVPAQGTGGSCAPVPDNPIAENGIYTANAVKISNCMFGSFDNYISTIGGYRSSSRSGNHETGCALDIMIRDWDTAPGVDHGDEIAKWLQDRAKEMGVQYLIWRQRIWSVPRASEGWRPLEDRGSDTANHFDHVHVSVFGSRCVDEV